jgi:hypothetical protein
MNGNFTRKSGIGSESSGSSGSNSLLYDFSEEIMSSNSTFYSGESGEEDMNMTDLLSDTNAGGDGSISWEEVFRDNSRFWVQRVLVPIVVIIGVMGNLITIYILTRRPMRSSTNV